VRTWGGASRVAGGLSEFSWRDAQQGLAERNVSKVRKQGGLTPGTLKNKHCPSNASWWYLQPKRQRGGEVGG